MAPPSGADRPPLVPGPDGTPLPAAAKVVFRLGKGDSLMTPEDFILSTDDKECPVPRLSVWIEGMTTIQQALTFVPGASRFKTAGFSLVEAIRAIVPDPAIPAVKLEVAWEKARKPDGADQVGPGAEGHAGIERLDDGQRNQRKSFRGALARLANGHRVEVIQGLEAPPLPGVEPTPPSG